METLVGGGAGGGSGSGRMRPERRECGYKWTIGGMQRNPCSVGTVQYLIVVLETQIYKDDKLYKT